MTSAHDPCFARPISLTVNARERSVVASTRRTLADLLREDLGLTGTHIGCEQGVCGACTVKVDGEIVRSCLVLGVQCDGRSVETIESVALDGELSIEQTAFWEKHGLQCGFCTPGLILTVSDFLDNNGDPTEDEAREAISGNVCRCTGYQFIVDAVLDAAAHRQDARMTSEES